MYRGSFDGSKGVFVYMSVPTFRNLVYSARMVYKRKGVNVVPSELLPSRKFITGLLAAHIYKFPKELCDSAFLLTLKNLVYVISTVAIRRFKRLLMNAYKSA